MRRRTWSWLVLTAFLLWTPVSAQIIDEVVSNVNGEMISWTDLSKREGEIRRDLNSRLSGPELEEAMQ